MWLYLFVLLAGAIVGYYNLVPENIKKKSSTIQLLSLILMLFVLGAKIGMDDAIIKNFGVIGLQSLLIAVFTIVGSVTMVKLISKHMIKPSSSNGGKDQDVS